MSLIPPQQYAYPSHPRQPTQNQMYGVEPYPPSNYENPLLSNYHLAPHSYSNSPYMRKNYHHPKQMSTGSHHLNPSPFKSASKHILPPGPHYDHQPRMYQVDPGYNHRRSMDSRDPYGGERAPYGGGYYSAYTDADDGFYGDYYGGGRAQSGGPYGAQDHEKALKEISKIRDLRRAFEDLRAPADLLQRFQGSRSNYNRTKGKKQKKNRRYERSLESSYETEYTNSEESYETEETEDGHPKMALVQNLPVIPVNYNGGYALAVVPPEQFYQLEANQMQQVNMPIPVENTGKKTFRPSEKYVPPPKNEKSLLQGPRRGQSDVRTDMSVEHDFDKTSQDLSKEMVIFGNDAMLSDILGPRRTERRIDGPKRETKSEAIMNMVQATGNSTYKQPPRREARRETLEEVLIRNRVDEDDMKVLRRNLKDILYKPANLKESQEILEASFEKQNTVANSQKTHNGNGSTSYSTQNKTSIGKTTIKS